MWPGWIYACLRPPLFLFLLAGTGWLLARRRKRAGRWLVAFSLGALVLLSMPLVSASLLRSLEEGPAVGPGEVDPTVQAIVCLGGDAQWRAPEYPGGASVGALTLERLRYAAELQRRTQLPLLVTGGRFRPEQPPLGELMAAVLTRELGVEVAWVEGRSRNTQENAALSAQILAPKGIGRILLVTHAWHMRRARRCFESVGLEVVVAPTGFTRRPRAADLWPTSKGLRESSLAFHEWVGAFWYRLRYR